MPTKTTIPNFMHPLERLAESPWYAVLVSTIAAGAQWVFETPLLVAGLALGVLGAWDFLLGTQIARRDEAEDDARAWAGLLDKATGFVYIGVLWLIEAKVIGTPGALAAGIAMMFIVREFRSIERNRYELTGRPTPGLSAVLDFLDGIAAGFMRQPPKDPPAEQDRGGD